MYEMKLSEIKEVLRFLDYTESGGAPLLGVNGVTILCHGSSPARAIKNAIRAAIREIEHNILDVMTERVSHAFVKK